MVTFDGQKFNRICKIDLPIGILHLRKNSGADWFHVIPMLIGYKRSAAIINAEVSIVKERRHTIFKIIDDFGKEHVLRIKRNNETNDIIERNINCLRECNLLREKE